MASFQLELVSPEKLLLSRKVDLVVFPAAEGEMGVLAGHAPMIVSLRGGVISVSEGGKVTEQLFVAGGFAEVAADRVTILAEEATPLSSLSKAEAQLRIVDAEASLAAAANDAPEKRDAAMERVLSARAMLEAATAA
jgi:F-type H+-transporting ATPase subunit epsilon